MNELTKERKEELRKIRARLTRLKKNDNTGKPIVKSDICSRCRGVCCKNLGCALAPSDVPIECLSNISDMRNLLMSGKYSLDYYSFDDIGTVRFIRMRNRYAPVADGNYVGNECIMLTSTGCALSYEDRPAQGRYLEPRSENECRERLTKSDMALLWYPYANILNPLYDEFRNDLKLGIPRGELRDIISVSDYVENPKCASLYINNASGIFMPDEYLVIEGGPDERIIFSRHGSKWVSCLKGTSFIAVAYTKHTIWNARNTANVQQSAKLAAYGWLPTIVLSDKWDESFGKPIFRCFEATDDSNLDLVSKFEAIFIKCMKEIRELMILIPGVDDRCNFKCAYQQIAKLRIDGVAPSLVKTYEMLVYDCERYLSESDYDAYDIARRALVAMKYCRSLRFF